VAAWGCLPGRDSGCDGQGFRGRQEIRRIPDAGVVPDFYGNDFTKKGDMQNPAGERQGVGRDTRETKADIARPRQEPDQRPPGGPRIRGAEAMDLLVHFSPGSPCRNITGPSATTLLMSATDAKCKSWRSPAPCRRGKTGRCPTSPAPSARRGKAWSSSMPMCASRLHKIFRIRTERADKYLTTDLPFEVLLRATRDPVAFPDHRRTGPAQPRPSSWFAEDGRPDRPAPGVL